MEYRQITANKAEFRQCVSNTIEAVVGSKYGSGKGGSGTGGDYRQMRCDMLHGAARLDRK